MDDIARELAVSKSTVSKALNGAKDVSKAMRQCVLEKAVELGYSRIPRQADAPRLAVFITNMEYKKPEDFGYDILVGFRKAAEPAGFLVELIELDQDLQNKMHYDQYMVMGNFCAALFLVMSLLDPWIKDFETCLQACEGVDYVLNQAAWGSVPRSIEMPLFYMTTTSGAIPM